MVRCGPHQRSFDCEGAHSALPLIACHAVVVKPSSFALSTKSEKDAVTIGAEYEQTGADLEF
jgi:hypothetical protein